MAQKKRVWKTHQKNGTQGHENIQNLRMIQDSRRTREPQRAQNLRDQEPKDPGTKRSSGT